MITIINKKKQENALLSDQINDIPLFSNFKDAIELFASDDDDEKNNVFDKIEIKGYENPIEKNY